MSKGRWESDLRIREVDGSDHWELLTPLAYRTSDGQRITVPIAFRTDFASVPRPLWSVFPKTGRHQKAAVIHDYLYAHNGVTRAQADAVFCEAMETSGVGWWTRNAMYAAVRAGGGQTWGRYRANVRDAIG